MDNYSATQIFFTRDTAGIFAVSNVSVRIYAVFAIAAVAVYSWGYGRI